MRNDKDGIKITITIETKDMSEDDAQDLIKDLFGEVSALELKFGYKIEEIPDGGWEL